MKKFFVSSVLLGSFLLLCSAQESNAAVSAHVSGKNGSVKVSVGHGHRVHHRRGGHYRPYRHHRHVYRRPILYTSGVTYVSREIGTGEVKQVVNVAPPVYVPYYY